ncbi:IclR family transcriptional regulator [Undibacterium sp. TJN25]|uniref:IclR family transcriptional regulator n=1 Tax=Undibacterium sp. TJN25 TaxID=3413056 RepID=UPI003BF067C9
MPTSPADAAVSSSRRLTQSSKKFTRDTAGSQSLERGLQLLRVFRAGVAVLTNSELALRTGLPRPTVSRLTRSLVDAGFLNYDLQRRAYRLSSICLSLSDAYSRANPQLGIAEPLMKQVADREKVNIGMAISDQSGMIYLLAFRESEDAVSKTRRLVPGSHVPMEMTAIGRAYLTGLESAERDERMNRFASKAGRKWPALKAELTRCSAEIDRLGYCTAEWEPGGLFGIATRLWGPDGTLYAINLSFQSVEGDDSEPIARLAPVLLQLVADIDKAWKADGPAEFE